MKTSANMMTKGKKCKSTQLVLSKNVTKIGIAFQPDILAAARPSSIDNVKIESIIELGNVKSPFSSRSHSTVAENEYLDATKARRWQSVAQAIRERSADSVVTEKIEVCLYKTLRQIRKDLPLDKLIGLLDTPEQLRDECHRIAGAHDVKYFLIDAADQDTDLKGKLSYFLNQSLENCLHDVPFLVADVGENVSVTEARSIIRNAARVLQSEIQRIAEKLAENPKWLPRRVSRRDNSGAKVNTTETMLGESLLSGFRK